MQLTSAAFKNDEQIPKRFTGDGEDISPPLAWEGAPGDTQAFALIVDDPDAPGGTFVHWLLYDLGKDVDVLEEGLAPSPRVLGGARQGKNDFGRFGYGGPAPPPPAEHRYIFQLLALDAPTGLEAGAGRKELEAATEGHVLATAVLTGRYKR